MLKGSCACGHVKYDIRGALQGPVTYCHCWRCRKHSGSSFGTTAGVKADELVFTFGADLLAFWESSPGVKRLFASCCGSPIHKSGNEHPDYLGFRLGTLDEDPGVQVDLHYMVVSKAPWVRFGDDLRQEPGEGPAFGAGD
jgi:hypothetical protein